MVIACLHRTSEPAPEAALAVPTPVEAAPTDSELSQTWYARAVMAEVRGDREEAIRAVDWLLRVDGTSPWAHLGAARVLIGVGELERAREHIAWACAHGGPDAVAEASEIAGWIGLPPCR